MKNTSGQGEVAFAILLLVVVLVLAVVLGLVIPQVIVLFERSVGLPF
jgi:hypothetical protein